MNKCPKCGKMFEGNFCPECGSSPTGERLCPNCKKKVPSTAKFCAECGFTLTPQVQPKAKKKSPKAWLKSHKKLLGWSAAALVVVLILVIVIPVSVHNRHNGTYYLYSNEEYNYEKYYIFKGSTYTDETGYSGDVEFDGEKVELYAELFGVKDVAAHGTLKDDVLTLEDPLGKEKVYAKKGTMHEHEFGNWTVQTPSTCTQRGTEVRKCKGCEKTETRTINQLAEHQGTWKVTKEATCTETGLREKHCTVCGQDITETIELQPHKLGEWKVTKEATCTETGLREKHCTVCGQDFPETIETLPHEASDEIWQYDYTYHWQICVVCGNVFNHAEHTSTTTGSCTECQFPLVDTEGLRYSLNESETGYIVSGLGSVTSKIIRVPESYNKLPVVAIGEKAFYGKSNLTFIGIPDSVTSIGSYAFSSCSGLTSVTIPDSVTEIGSSAFYGCSGLTSVTIPDSVTEIGGGAFWLCSGLTSITIGNGVTTIGNRAFCCSGLTSIIIPNNVTSIGYEAFYRCSGLTSVTIPDSVTSIGSSVFNRIRDTAKNQKILLKQSLSRA